MSLSENVSIVPIAMTTLAPETVFIDPRRYAATDAEKTATLADLKAAYGPPSPSSRSSSPTLSRTQVDRARRVSIALGGWCPVSSLALCEEVQRLHDALAAIAHALRMGRPEVAIILAESESDPSWGQPLD